MTARLSFRGSFLATLALLVAFPSGAGRAAELAEVPNPFPRQLHVGEVLRRWEFATESEGWRAANDCQAAVADGALQVQSTGHDPYLIASVEAPGGLLVLKLRMKSRAAGVGQVFWATDKEVGFLEANSRHFAVRHDGQWHEYSVPLEVVGQIQRLRLDPVTAAGAVEIDWLTLHRGGLPPVELAAIRQEGNLLTTCVRNYGSEPIVATVDGQPLTLAAGATATAQRFLSGSAALEAVSVEVAAPDWPPQRRSVWVCRPPAMGERVTCSRGPVALEVVRDGTLGRILRDGRQVAVLAPLVPADCRLKKLTLVASDTGALTLSGEGTTVQLGLNDAGEVTVSIASGEPVEGPVVQVSGGLEQGLFAGLEYLGQGEQSSSKLDIETAEHLRFAPDPMKVTMPLLAVVTGASSVALTWNDMGLQPTFASPNFVDGTTDHRLSLRGSKIDAVLRIGPGWEQGGRVEDAILWAVKRRGLPPVPPAPRSYDEQMRLSLAAYGGMIRSPDGGWYHAIVPGHRGHGVHFADHVSAIWRITGRAPETPQLAHGGAHVQNPASYFVTGRAAQWLRTIDDQARKLIASQQPDGSYHYRGEFRRGHFEDTASGICAQPAMLLLDHAWYTDNEQSLAAGLKTLQYMTRFRTPRGSQTWELSLHTPDILASAQLVWAYTRGYELTGDRQWLDLARRWAITGLPFVYQWSNQPIMLYATVPVYGATHYRGPNWMGLPVQWCGTVYAYALLLLAPHDTTLNWRQVAEGILVAGEQMQYPDGPSRGCLPDVFNLPQQLRQPADINPGALVSLRLRLAGKLDSLAVAVAGPHRVVAPFPVTIHEGQAHLDAAPGVRYQVVVDGRRVVDVQSQGKDAVPLD